MRYCREPRMRCCVVMKSRLRLAMSPESSLANAETVGLSRMGKVWAKAAGANSSAHKKAAASFMGDNCIQLLGQNSVHCSYRFHRLLHIMHPNNVRALLHRHYGGCDGTGQTRAG